MYGSGGIVDLDISLSHDSREVLTLARFETSILSWVGALDLGQIRLKT